MIKYFFIDGKQSQMGLQAALQPWAMAMNETPKAFGRAQI